MQLTEKYRAGAEARCELKEEQESVGTLEESWRIVRANEKMANCTSKRKKTLEIED
jgi:hypothetical protein